MRLLKSAVCLAMLTAGIAAVPTTLAGASSAPAAGPSLVSQMTAEADGSVVTSSARSTGKVGFIRAKGSGADLMPGTAASDRSGAAAKADAYLARYSSAFGAAKGTLQREGVRDNGHGWTVDYTQSYRGVPVFGALVRAHVDEQGDLTAVNGFAAPDTTLSTSPRLSASAGADRAVAFVKSAPAATDGQKAGTLRAASNKLMIYRTGSTKGVDGRSVLAYVVEVTDGAGVRDMVFVDANAGKILNRYSMVDNALDRELYEEDPDSVPVWTEGDDLDEDCTLPNAGDCGDDLNIDQRNLVLSSGESYWFFKNAFNRDSYDGNGATRKTVNNDPTIACPNANWNGETTNYCDGVTSDDVVAHEWGHAYTEYTHGLIYQWQSGALNESYSDIWGETLDLINNREDEGEGDISAKRANALCADNGPRAVQVVINNPASVRKVCLAGPASWGGIPDTTGITSDIVLALDADEDGAGTANTTFDGCSPLTNGAAMAGKVGMVRRGACDFTLKAQHLIDAGATAVVIANTLGRGAFSPGGGIDPPFDEPVVGISDADGSRIQDALSGGAVNVTVRLSGTAETADSYRWLIGEKSTAFGGAIRDMWAPTCAGDPGKVSDIEYACSTDDQGGVHSNSGVPNHGYALLVDGGTFNGQTVAGIGLTKAAAIYYRAMTEYQTPVSNFADHADSLEASCADLVGKALKELSTEPNTSQTASKKITATDCEQVAKMATALELRSEPVQCDFGPLLDPATPAACGSGFQESESFSDDFESGISDWTLDSDSVFDGPTRDWRSSSDLPEGNLPPGDTQAAFGPAPDLGTCTEDENDFSSANYMTSPEIEVGDAGDTGPRLIFDHNIQTELGFDGGTVFVSVNGGDAEPVPASAYLFNAPSTLATEAAGSTNPLAGLDGFTGTDGGQIVSDWGTSVIDLAQMGVSIGDTIQVTFGIGRDGCGGVVGWWVDNVRVVTCQVKVKTAPTVEGTHAPEPSTVGQAHSVNVTVGGADGAGTGTVTVKEGATTLGSAPLTAGAATVPLPTSMPAGTHSLTVEYSGDANYLTGTDSVTATVAKATGTIKAKATPATVKKGDTFKSKVKVRAPAGISRTGTVEISYQGKVLGQGTTGANGKVTIELTAKFKPGKKITLTATFKGNAQLGELITTYDLKMAKKA